MDNVVRAVDVGFGNTKFVTGVSETGIRCGIDPIDRLPERTRPGHAAGG